MVVDGARRRLEGLDRGRALTVMLGAVTHDFGKPATTAFIDGHIRSRGHEAAGVAPATAFLDRLNIHTVDGFDVRKHVLTIVSDHLAPGMWHKSSTPVGDGAFRRLAARVDLELLARVAEADCEGRTGRFDCSAMTWFRERAEALGVQHAPPAPILLGRHLLDLGVSPGPRMGVLLKQAYEHQLDNGFTDLDGALAFARTLLPPS
jgi:tRNA nucleotidyltransferase (CCA-adding enzyme)